MRGRAWAAVWASAACAAAVACGRIDENADADDPTSTPANARVVARPVVAGQNVLEAGVEAGSAYMDASDADASDGCARPLATDPCDCRWAISSCASPWTCGVSTACDAPFWYDRQACFLEHRLGGADGCADDGGVRCCDRTQDVR